MFLHCPGKKSSSLDIEQVQVIAEFDKQEKSNKKAKSCDSVNVDVHLGNTEESTLALRQGTGWAHLNIDRSDYLLLELCQSRFP